MAAGPAGRIVAWTGVRFRTPNRPPPPMPATPPAPCASFDVRDALLIDQQLYALAAEPLAMYFALADRCPPFAGTTSGSGRGYQATWELRDGRLYLVGLRGTLAGGLAGSLADVFPDFHKRVFAHWYSGTLHAHSPRMAIGAVVLDGIEIPGCAGSLHIEIERGILLSAVQQAGTAAPARARVDAPPTPLREVAA